jgi:hypothetical protein
MSLKRRYTGSNVRAKATNGTIITSWTFKKSELTLEEPCDTTDAFDFTQLCAKQALWRTSENKYVLGGNGDDNQHLVGLVESGTMGHNNTYTFKVSMRGVIHVPVWAFSEDEWKEGWHTRWGRVFERPEKLHDLPSPPTSVENLNEMSQFDKRLLRVFFRV